MEAGAGGVERGGVAGVRQGRVARKPEAAQGQHACREGDEDEERKAHNATVGKEKKTGGERGEKDKGMGKGRIRAVSWFYFLRLRFCCCCVRACVGVAVLCAD